uniref:Uncharacterized protein n=1 Tax=Candidozyma auris TaxID=498019 RepID=A0A0L0P1Y8_CANAR
MASIQFLLGLVIGGLLKIQLLGVYTKGVEAPEKRDLPCRANRPYSWQVPFGI